MPDEEVVARVCAGETALFEMILRRYNQRLYRVARAILADDEEALDAVQSTYLRAYTHLTQFDGRSSLGTWLTRITINEARGRTHSRGLEPMVGGSESQRLAGQERRAAPAAEHQAALGEIRRLLERAVEQLPEAFRTVFILRDVEQLATSEAAELLDIPEPTVKTRLHRARGLLRRQLSVHLGSSVPHMFEFGGARCDRLVGTVMAKIGRHEG